MINNIIKLLNNHKGSITIEFVGVFIAFTSILYIASDVYTATTLQDNLERTNYTVASLFRERSALYPMVQDTINDTSSLQFPYPADHYKSYEVFTIEQVQEAQKLAEMLLNKEVSIRIDGLFLKQDTRMPYHPGDSNSPIFDPITLSVSSCTYSSCSTEIKNYLDNRPDMTNTSITDKDYTKLVPFTPKRTTFKTIGQGVGMGGGIVGRFIPIYRISMCINGEESLYLKMSDRENSNNRFIPNLCSETVVISRCNDLRSVTQGCPIYVYTSH